MSTRIGLTEAASPQETTPSRPVFFFPADLNRAKDRSQRLPWARKAWEKIQQTADRWRASPAAVPEGPPGLFHDYFCPDHGTVLRYDARRPTEHLCPEDGRIWSGPKLDGYWVTATIRNQLEAGVCCGLAWRITGREEYAWAAAELLQRFAKFYDERVAPNTPRRWMRQSLDEAVCILDAVRIFELVSGSKALSPLQAHAVVGQYLVPTARFLMGERRNIHNIDCWFNAAILAIGAATSESSLVNFALGGTPESRHGFRDQVREGVTAEHLWREGSIAYHYYALSALGQALLAARGVAKDLGAERDTVRAMYLAPFALADERWVIPATNDGQPNTLDRFADHYETAVGLFPEEAAFEDFLAAAGARNEDIRGSREALLYGPEEPLPPGGPAPAKPGRVFPESGLAVLRSRPVRPGGGEIYALLDFGPHGGTHGHPDKLSVCLHALGRVLAPDLGTSGYGIALGTSWYRQSLSHNTLVIDRRSQRPASGRLLSFNADGAVQQVIASAGEACPGLEWTRGVFLAEEGYLVVLDRALPGGGGLLLPQKHLFDWVWHSYGELEVNGTRLMPNLDRACFGVSEGYQVPEQVSLGRTSGPVTARWQVKADTPTQPGWLKPKTAGSLNLWLSADSDLKLYTATAPGNPARHRLPFVVGRRAGLEARFRAVLEPVPAGAESRVKSIELLPEGVRVITDAGSREFLLP